MFALKIPYSLFFAKFLSSILMGTVEKSISLNLIKIILKFGFVLITFSRSLDFEINIFIEWRIVVEIFIK